MDTALQCLTNLEGSVTKLEPIANDAVKLLDVTNGKGSILNVTGGGKLFAVLNYDAKLDLFIDGVKKLTLLRTFDDGGLKSGSYVCSKYFKGTEYGAANNNTGRYLLSSFGTVCMYTQSQFSDNETIVGIDTNTFPKTISKGVGITIEPIVFTKSLEIKSTSGVAKALIAYSLDQ